VPVTPASTIGGTERPEHGALDAIVGDVDGFARVDGSDTSNSCSARCSAILASSHGRTT